MASLHASEALFLVCINPLGGAGLLEVTYLAAVAAHGSAILCRRPLCLSLALAVLALATAFAAHFATTFATSAFALSPRFSLGTERHQQFRVVFSIQLCNLSLPAPRFIGHGPLHELVCDHLGLGQEELVRTALHGEAPCRLKSPLLGNLIALEVPRDHVGQELVRDNFPEDPQALVLQKGTATTGQEFAGIRVPSLQRFGQLLWLVGALWITQRLCELVAAFVAPDVYLLGHPAPHLQALEDTHIAVHLLSPARQINVEEGPK